MNTEKDSNDPPPPVKSLFSPRKQIGKPSLAVYHLHACLTEKQWGKLTAWCVEHYDWAKRTSLESVVKRACQDRPIGNSLIDSNSITEAMKAAAFRLKRHQQTPNKGSTDGNSNSRA